jgi:hypothetical protein
MRLITLHKKPTFTGFLHPDQRPKRNPKILWSRGYMNIPWAWSSFEYLLIISFNATKKTLTTSRELAVGPIF